MNPLSALALGRPVLVPATGGPPVFVSWDDWTAERAACCGLFDHLPVVHERIRRAEARAMVKRRACRACRTQHKQWVQARGRVKFERAIVLLCFGKRFGSEIWAELHKKPPWHLTRFDRAIILLCFGRAGREIWTLLRKQAPAPIPRIWCLDHEVREPVYGELALRALLDLDAAYGDAVVKFVPGGLLISADKRADQLKLARDIPKLGGLP